MNKTNTYKTYELRKLWGNSVFITMIIIMLTLEDQLYCADLFK